MPDTDAATRATGRALTLLTILDREHTCERLHAAARACRHELQTILAALAGPDAEVVPQGPLTARELAARRASSTRPLSGRAIVLGFLVAGEGTDAELAARTEGIMTPGSTRVRRVELCAAGWAASRPAGADEASRSGQAARNGQTIWVVTPAGQAAWNRLCSGQLELAI